MSDHTTDEIGASAALLQRASSPATADELEAADATISRFIEVVLEPPETAPARRHRALPVSTRVAAVVAAATLWSTGIAAAATGHLPDQVQHAVSHTASHVGLSLPDRSDEKTVEATDEQSQGNRATHQDDADSSSSSSAVSTTSATTTAPAAGSIGAAPTAGAVTSTAAAGASTTIAGDASRGVGPDVNGPAHDGLCNAYLRGLATGNPKNPDAPPWRNLIAGAKEAGKSVEAFCGSTTATTTATTVASAASTASTSSTTNTTAQTNTTVPAEGKPHGGGNSDGGGAGDDSNPGNGNGNGNGNGQANGHGNGNGKVNGG